METIKHLLCCLPVRSANDEAATHLMSTSSTSMDEKKDHSMTYPPANLVCLELGNLMVGDIPKLNERAIDAALEILETLHNAEKPGKDLNSKVGDILLHIDSSWFEGIAKGILNTLANTFKDGSPLRGAMQEAYDKAYEAATNIIELARQHPGATIAICVVLALGILVICAPAIIHLLGFGVEGPVAESFAASWQSTYGGYVEAGSLFSYLQRLGMIWK